jgi:hypothetical protein
LWEEQLKDPREAADAWRRVLRMKSGDADAQAGLERAKAAMLTQREAEEAAPPLPASDAGDDDEPPDLPPLRASGAAEHEQVVGASDEGDVEDAAGGEEVVPASIYDDETFDGTRELPEDTDHAGVRAVADIETAHGADAANGEEASDQDDILAVDDSDLVDEVDLVEELEEQPEPPRAPKR